MFSSPMEATSNPEPRPASLAMVLGHLPGVELVGVAQDGDEVVALTSAGPRR